MAYIKRILNIKKMLTPGRVLIIYGPRRVGKSTILDHFLSEYDGKCLRESGENIRLQNLLSSRDFSVMLPHVEGLQLYALDEAQLVPNVGTALKIFVDEVKGMLIIATGSSSFDLAQQVGEPLTGRKWTIVLYPFSQQELLPLCRNKEELQSKLEEILLFGTYPEVFLAETNEEKMRILHELVDSYVFKDILAMNRVKGSGQLLDLVKLLALQVGSEVSVGKLAKEIGSDGVTVKRYLDLLEKAFVIKKIGGYSNNLHKEVTSKAKYYFIDNGIRNAIINQWNGMDNRTDAGALFENFVVMERIKKLSYAGDIATHYFWRTYDGQEIDLVEDRPDQLAGIEIKYNPRKGVHAPKAWQEGYPKATFSLITKENYLDYLL